MADLKSSLGGKRERRRRRNVFQFILGLVYFTLYNYNTYWNLYYFSTNN